MNTDSWETVVRRAARVSVAGLALLAASTAGPASASPPDQWPDPGNPGALEALLVVVGVPALLFAVIVLLTYLPSMIHRQKYEPAVAFRDQPEWFGGPRQGLDKAPEAPGDSEKGGASAHW